MLNLLVPNTAVIVDVVDDAVITHTVTVNLKIVVPPNRLTTAVADG